MLQVLGASRLEFLTRMEEAEHLRLIQPSEDHHCRIEVALLTAEPFEHANIERRSPEFGGRRRRPAGTEARPDVTQSWIDGPRTDGALRPSAIANPHR